MPATPNPEAEPKSDVVVSKLTRTPEEYIKDRVEVKINRYAHKALRYRHLYWALAGGTAVISAFVPALLNIDRPWVKAAAAGLSAVVVVLVALQGVFHPREHWRNYDLISSLLREEEMLYSTKSGIYEDKENEGDEKLFRKFVERVEEAIAKERAETVEMRTAAPERKKDGK